MSCKFVVSVFSKLKKMECEKLKLLPVAALLIITPLLSTSLRFKYLYFIVNILIIALGAEAGLLSFFLHNPKPPPSLPHPICTPRNDDDAQSPSEEITIFYVHDHAQDDDRLMDDDDDDDELMMEDDDVEDHELYHKAETFIGNFYKQLKMQRQESWND